MGQWKGFLSQKPTGPTVEKEVAIYFRKQLPQKESYVDNGTGPQRQKDGAFEGSRYMESEVS